MIEIGFGYLRHVFNHSPDLHAPSLYREFEMRYVRGCAHLISTRNWDYCFNYEPSTVSDVYHIVFWHTRLKLMRREEQNIH